LGEGALVRNRKLPQVALLLPMPRPGFTEGISDGEKIIGSVSRLVKVDFDQRRPLAVLSVAGVYIGEERRDAEGRVG
jgi:hypothetical protein